MNHFKLYHLLAVLSITSILFSSGCKFLELFKNDKKQIKRQVERIKAAINNDNWKLVNSLMSDEFRWTSSDKVVFKTKKRGRKKIEFGKRYFQKSIDDLPKNRMAFYMHVTDFKKVTEERYVATVSSRLKIRKGAADNDNIKWISLQTWVKMGDKWYVSSIKDTTEKIGNGGLQYYTNPVLKRRPKRKKK